MATDEPLMGAQGNGFFFFFFFALKVRRHVHDERGGFWGEKVWEGEQKQALFLLWRLYIFLSFFAPLGFWRLRRYRCLMYTHFLDVLA